MAQFDLSSFLKSSLGQGLMQQFLQNGGASYFPGAEPFIGEGSPLGSLLQGPAGGMGMNMLMGGDKNQMSFPLLMWLLRRQM